jgi:membrane protease YdiL (CAAX protease family)
MSGDLLIAVGFYVVIVLLANAAERGGRTGEVLRPIVYGLLAALSVSFAAAFTFSPSATFVSVGLTGLIALLSLAVMSQPVRDRLAGVLASMDRTVQLNFNPRSVLHTTAIIMCLHLLGSQIISFAIGGGITGAAETFSAPTETDLIVQMVVFLIFATLGIGFGIRRSLSSTLQRLGVRFPTLIELYMAIMYTIAMLGFGFLFSLCWQFFVPPDVVEQQTELSQLISQSVGTMSLAFLLSLTAAVGEEVAFRGALQPTFGIIPTTILFAVLHTQYALTPATIVIVVVGAMLGYLRRRYNTTTAIIAHFLYNFAQLTLVVFARYALDTIDPSLLPQFIWWLML